MTVGDMVSGLESKTTTQSITIKPNTASVEWSIHNIYIPFGSTCEIYRTDGSNTILIMTTTSSLLSPYTFHVSTSQYITVKNVSGSTIYIGYDGVITME